MENILQKLTADRDEALSDLLSLIKIPSVSAEPAYAGDVQRCAEWLAALLRRDGFEADALPTPGHPVVLAQWRGAGPEAPTVLVYGHYDVQPAAVADGWTFLPFEPQLREGLILGRGATDDKGQLFCHVAGARAHLRATGSLPVNLIFLFEGEEESGSANLDDFLLAHLKELACDAVVVSDSAQYGAGIPALTYGLRGLCYLEARLTGPSRDLHSGSFGGAVRNPANALAKMLGALVGEDGRVAVPGFYDDVIPLEAWEREAYAKLAFDEGALAAELGVPGLFGEAGYTALERMWARPTLDVNGLWSGYTGEGAKTVLPSRAGAKLSCRLVPGQSPERVAELVQAHLKALCPPECALEVSVLHGARPVLLPTGGPAVEAAREALGAAWGVEPVFIREGGSIPVVETFARLLNAPVALMGFGRADDRAHGPDERFHLDDFYRGAEACARFYEGFSSRLRG